jgi:EmrB/QacA subfamily drug resistance transporter
MQTEARLAGSGLTPRQIHVVMTAVMTGMFLAAIDGTIVSTAMPTIVGELGNQSQAPWIHVAYLLTQCIATPIIGKLSDLFGRKQTFQATIVVFLAASVLAALAQDMPQLVAFRALQGIGAGGLLSLPMAIVGDILPPAERARYQGYIAASFAFATLLGPLAGGFFVDHLNWRWAFLINLPVGMLSMWLVHLRLHISRAPTRRSIDFLGAFVLSVAVSPVVLALLWSGEEHGWGSGATLGLLALGAAATVAFVFVERRAAEPILPMSLLSNKIIRTSLIGGLVIGVGMYGVSSWTVLFLQVVSRTSATASGLLTAPNAFAITAASVVSGRIIAKTRVYKPFPVIGTAILILGAVALATMNEHTGKWDVCIRLMIAGFGMGQIGPSMTIIVQNAVNYRELGVATAGFSFVRTLGGVVGSAAIGAVFQNRLNTYIPRYVGEEGMAALPDPDALRGKPSVIHALPQPVQDQVVRAFADAITVSIRVAIPVLVIAVVVFALIPNIPLRDRFDTSHATPSE